MTNLKMCIAGSTASLRGLFGGTALLLALLLGSCAKERDDFALDFIGSEERLGLTFDTLYDLRAYSDQLPSVPQLQFSAAPLGQIYDETFGLTTSTILLELFPRSYTIEGFGTELESAKLQLRLPGAYGSEGRMIVRCMTLGRELLLDEGEEHPELSNFPGVDTIAMGPIEAGAEMVELDLDPEWAVAFIGQAKDIDLFNYKEWAKLFKGVRLEIVREDPDSPGRMFRYNLGETGNGLHFRWKDPEGEVRTFKVGGRMDPFSRRAVFVDNSLTGSKLESYLGLEPSSQEEEQLFYLSSDANVRGVVDFTPMLEAYRSQFPLVVSRAELRIPLAPEQAPFSDTLVRAVVANVRQGESYFLAPDLATGKNNVYSGLYLPNKGYFELNITLFVQQLLQGYSDNPYLYLLPVSSGGGYSRAILSAGRGPGQKGMELHITYTKL